MAEKKQVWSYTVEGRWPFPSDMLRRDRSEGATPEDVALIRQFSADIKNATVIGEVRINLTSDCMPASERWASFKWKIVGEPQMELVSKPLSDKEKLALFDKIKEERDQLENLRLYWDKEQKKADDAGSKVFHLKNQLQQAENREAESTADADLALKELNAQKLIVETLLKELDDA